MSQNPVLIEFQCWNKHVGGMIASSKLHILKADVDSHKSLHRCVSDQTATCTFVVSQKSMVRFSMIELDLRRDSLQQ